MPGFKKEDHQTMHHVMSIVASFLSGDLLDPVLNILFFAHEWKPRPDGDSNERHRWKMEQKQDTKEDHQSKNG
jgi:hypothetical protein